MRTLFFKNHNWSKTILLAATAMVLALTGCTEDPCDDCMTIDPVNADQGPYASENWPYMVSDFMTDGELLFVENGALIQEAIDASNNGDVIVIQGGVYLEEIKLTDPIVKLMGIRSAGEDVTLPYTSSINDVFDVKTMDGVQAFLPDSTGDSFSSGGDNLVSWNRTALATRNVVHYTFDLKVDNQHVVTVHRLTRELQTFISEPTSEEVFLIPDADEDFEDLLNGPKYPTESSHTTMPTYLAENGTDVWAISFATTRDRALATDVESLTEALALARVVRALSGSGFGRMSLLGFGYGDTVADEAINRESQEAKPLRDIKVVIPGDQARGN